MSIFENRYFRLVSFTLATFLTSILYYGWQSYSLMLFKAGAYSWMCPDDWTSEDPCPEQDKKVQALYSVASGTEFIFAAVAGVMLDHVGPKVTVLIGEVVWGIGLLMVTYGAGSAGAGWAIVLGFFLHGAAVNVIAFPTLILADLFPNHRSVMMALCIASQTTATIVPAVLWEIWKANEHWSYPSLIWGYLGLIWLPIFVCLALSMPVKRPPPAAPSNNSDAQTDATPKKGSFVEESTSSAPVAAVEPFSCKTFSWELSRLDYILFLVYYVANLLQFMYYPTTVRSEHGESVSQFFGWIMWMQGPIGLFMGWLCKYTGTVVLCLYLSISTAFTYALTMLPSEGVQYFTTFLFNTAQSYIYTTKYTWIDEMYSATNYGKLVGGISLTAGLFTYLNIPISASDNKDMVYLIYIVVSVGLVALLAFLYVRQYTYGVEYKTENEEKNMELTGDIVAKSELSAHSVVSEV